MGNKQVSNASRSHHDCRLGQWYYNSETAKHYANISAFKQLEHPHEEVHAVGNRALELCKMAGLLKPALNSPNWKQPAKRCSAFWMN